MKDTDIIALFDARDEQAISELHNKYGRDCRAVAMRILNDESDADECVNDAYLKVWNSIPPAIPDKLGPFVSGVVHNTAIDRLRKIKAQKNAPAGGFLSIEDSRFSEPVTDHWTDPLGIGKGDEGAMIADGIDPGGQRVIRLTEEYLRSIKPKKRKIFFARFYYERSIKDIAGIMHIPTGTVITNLRRTREGLRRFLKSKGIEI